MSGIGFRVHASQTALQAETADALVVLATTAFLRDSSLAGPEGLDWVLGVC